MPAYAYCLALTPFHVTAQRKNQMRRFIFILYNQEAQLRVRREVREAPAR